MADKYDTAQKLLILDNKINQEISKVSEEIRVLKEEDNSNVAINFHRLNHIQDLFDEASEVIKQLKIDNETDNLIEVLEVKRHIQENFGSFQFIRRETNNIAKNRIKDEKILDRVPTEQVPFIDSTEIVQETIGSGIDDAEITDEYDLELNDEKDLLAEKQAKKEKSAKERARQERLRKEREEREKTYRENSGKPKDDYRFIKNFEDNDRYSEQQRQEEAYRMGMRVTEDRHITATDLQREKHRQYEDEIAAREREAALKRQEQETFDRYRQREEEISNYESFGKEHIDFSSEYQKERNLQREDGKPSYYETKYQSYIDTEKSSYRTEPSLNTESHADNKYSDRASYYDYKYYSYAPPQSNDSYYSVYENKTDRFIDDNIYEHHNVISNQEIYKSIDNQIKTAKETGTSPTISAVYTDMLKRNVDIAHDYWKQTRGTPEESIAIQQYKEQRRYLDEVRRDIRNDVYKIEGESYTPVNHISYGNRNPLNSNAVFSSYVPGGTVSEPSSIPTGAKGQYAHTEDKHHDNILYTPENPMVVSKEYRDTIYKRAIESRETFNKLVEYGQNSQLGPLKISEKTTAEMALAMDAYKGFRNAEKAGIVVVSQSSGIKNPDFNMWQQRRDIKYDSYIKDFPGRTSKNVIVQAGNYTDEKPIVVSAEYRDMIYSRGITGQKYLSGIYPGLSWIRNKPDLTPNNQYNTHNLNTKRGQRVDEFADFEFRPKIPLVVSKEYRDTIIKRAMEPQKYISDSVSNNWKAKLEAQLAVDVYKSFRKAEKDGVVVVSNDPKSKKTDLNLWENIKNTKNNTDKNEIKDKGSPSVGEGTQGGFKFFNRTKSGLEDSPHFSQKKLYAAHFNRIYGHTKHYVARAGRAFGRRMYSELQSGDDNALRTFEQGRYYISTGVVFTNAVVHARVINSGKASTLADSSKVALANKLNGNAKLQNYQATNDLRAKIYKELENDKFIGVTRKQIGRKVDELTMHHRAKVEKKFGELAKLSDSKLSKQIETLKISGANIKQKIKELESLGASLTPAQRKTLLELKKLHEANSLKLRKLFGLQKERAAMDLSLGILREGSDKISRNMRAYTNGLYALRNFISKPFREGDVYAAGGLYNAATFIANRHTRMIIKKSIKASMWLSGKTVDAAYLLTGNDPMLWRNAVDVVKLNARVKVDTTKKAIKVATDDARRKTIKTARQGAKFVGNKITDYTPTKIRTAAKNSWNGLVSAKRKIDMITGSIRERYQRSFIHKGISTVRTWVDRATKSIRMAFNLVSKILTKVILGFSVGFLALVLIVTIMGAFMSASSAGGSILSPYDSEEEGKINLAPYMRILNEEQSDFDKTLNQTLQTKTYRGKKYDKVTINYATSLRSNHKEMLSMMAVRFKQDIGLEDNLSVRLYLKSLYHDSHIMAARESEFYSCSGCKTRTIKHNPGCEEHIEYCNGILDLRKCTNKNEDGVCEGHKKYTCPGHEEIYCPGKHIDLTLTVSVLGFDEIFTADSMANAGANVQAGGLIGNATITYYCAEKYPHICNAGPPYLTASGTTPTPNRTIAVDPKKIPLGKHVVIFGQEYIAEDTGGAIDGMHIDILVATHAEALAKGTRYNVPIYNVSIEGEGGAESEEWEGWTKDNIEWAKVIYSPNWSDIYEGINDYGNGNIEIGNLVVAGDWIWPVTATTSSSGFGWRDDPMNPGNPDFHKGTDIAIPEGTPVHAAGDGTVAASNFSSSAGNMIIINHADGVVTKYYHNSQLLVSVGDKVKAGQVIAYSGNTGNSTGPHLHFEFWVNGKVMDPRLQYGL